MTYAFTDRASYLIAFTMWKNDLHAIIEQIRANKHALRETQRQFDQKTARYVDLLNVIYERRALIKKIASHMEIRNTMKIQAQRQYLMHRPS